MTQQLDDTSSAPVTVRRDDHQPISSYTLVAADGSTVGRADFFDSPTVPGERIFFHTEVDAARQGQGLARLLVREALADSIRNGVTVVPVCPLFASHLKQHGDEHLRAGGRFRQPAFADIALFKQVAQSDA